MRREIVLAHEHVHTLLKSKRVDYEALRSALVPQANRFEYSFLFDTTRISSGWYGYEVASKLLPVLPRELGCSILSGDLLLKDQDMAFKLLDRFATLHKPCEVAHTSQLYCIYINNLSHAMFENIHKGLMQYDPYVGYIPCRFSSKAKDWLSSTLVHSYVKSKGTVICGHEDDRPDEDDVNILGWPWEEHKFRCMSLRSMYWDLFLAYKIERAVYEGFESDTKFSLSAISDNPINLTDSTVLIDAPKMDYLRTQKLGRLAEAGLSEVEPTTLAELIHSKIEHNYIYDLRFRPDFEVSSFSLIIEVENPKHEFPSRLRVVLKYEPIDSTLHLLTLF